LLSPAQINRGVRRTQIAAIVMTLFLGGALQSLALVAHYTGEVMSPKILYISLGLLILLLGLWMAGLAYIGNRLFTHCPTCGESFAGQAAHVVVVATNTVGSVVPRYSIRLRLTCVGKD
jgi:hypothetical protein